MLYSAAGVTFPSQQGAPPITTQRPTFFAIDGFRISAQGKIGKRPKRDDYEAGIPFNGFDHRVDSMQLAGRLTGRRVVMISEAVAAMKPGRAFMHSKQRLLGANKHRNAGSAEFDCIKRVAGG